MTYLIGEIILYLLLALALGLLAGWLLRGLSDTSKITNASAAEWSGRMSTAEADYEARALTAEATMARLRADLAAAESRAAVPPVPAPDAGLASTLRAAEALAEERAQALSRAQAALQMANDQALHRVAAAEDEMVRLRNALEESEARAATPAGPIDDGRLSALEAEIARLQALNAELENTSVPRPVAPVKARKARTMPEGEDDLLMLSGLGPVMERALRGAGISTYKALADMSDDDAKALTVRIGNHFADRFQKEGWAAKARAAHTAKYG
jgi:predicted flap endonuclease-1-like 5' DNA nuclease